MEIEGNKHHVMVINFKFFQGLLSLPIFFWGGGGGEIVPTGNSPFLLLTETRITGDTSEVNILTNSSEKDTCFLLIFVNILV